MSALRTPAVLLGLATAMGLAGCQPKIGDSCTLSTDCSTAGDRLCDTSQPQGYCTVFNCRANLCPDKAACVMFNAAIPGCGFDDRNGSFGSRAARSFCLARCESDTDCRVGYRCVDPRTAPYNGIILDNDQTQLGCVVIDVDGGAPPVEDAGVADGGVDICQDRGPDLPAIDAGGGAEGGVPPLFPDAGADGGDAGAGGG